MPDWNPAIPITNCGNSLICRNSLKFGVVLGNELAVPEIGNG
jgi:hypothetical protein